jgi:translation elongation factor EF-Tu-like GTPase
MILPGPSKMIVELIQPIAIENGMRFVRKVAEQLVLALFLKF